MTLQDEYDALLIKLLSDQLTDDEGVRMIEIERTLVSSFGPLSRVDHLDLVVGVEAEVGHQAG
jgi:hypothetical protein